MKKRIFLIFLVLSFWPLCLLYISIKYLLKFLRYLIKEKYFKSKKFLEHKQAITSAIEEYNELANYVNSFEEISLVSVDSDNYKYSHLATYDNTSSHNIKRNRNVRNLSDNVHQASLQVVKKASEEPLKYFCKYFNISANEENLQHIQEMGETVSRFSNAKENLETRLSKIETDFNPPKFIKKYYYKELLKHLEIDVPSFSFQPPQYIFEYVSAGGNSSQRTTITLNESTLEGLAEYISERIKYGKTIKVQRSLMTKKLREYIKARDDYTCQNCQVSIAQQSLLLLEVDHILPVSKGGLSTEENLQTLCWKCNRSKSDKII